GSEKLIVSVTASGAYLVNDRELVNSGPDTLRAAILKVAGDNRGAPVSVRADGRASHQSVVTAMDVLAKLGFVQLNVLTTNAAGADTP
ncbi:MAG TPA: biopolymer transporter ExbD, partial [Steroidobacteraceae bacterium]|nr:biopolymer transporter ExbD [Steroidobacteraceae bacterium]